jgi:Fe-Mn family superoxide dismutase
MFVLPDLPYAYDALAPVISDQTMRLHHDKHHATYVKTTNELLDKAGKSAASLEAVIEDSAKASERKLFNNAAQAWNHAFFWAAMSPERVQPKDALKAAIDKTFGDLAALKTAFVTAGADQFGSGWAWLVSDAEGALRVLSTHDADDFVSLSKLTPLIVCDVWEHAYYLDHKNDRKAYLEAWFDALPNWRFAGSQFAAATGQREAWRYPAPRTQTQGRAA